MKLFLVIVSTLLVTGLSSSRAEQTSREAPIELPAIVVTDSKLLPLPESWQYAKTGNFEILSNASVRKTKYVVRDLLEFTRAVSFVWPAIQPNNVQTPLLILCGANNSYTQFAPAENGPTTAGGASLSLRDKENAAIVIDLARSYLNIQNEDGATQIEVDYTQQLHREYVHFLLSRIEQRPQPWLEEGLAQMLASMKYSSTLIEFAKLPDPNEVSVMQGMALRNNQIQTIASSDPSSADANTIPAFDPGPDQDKAFNTALSRRGFIPLDKMFSVKRSSEEALNTIGGSWSKQCWLFVHLCLYGENQRYQKSFIKFIVRSEKEPITEALFKECFNMSYKDMLMVFRGYVQWTSYKSIEMRPKDGKNPSTSDILIRDATDAEVGRMKGEALRMAGHPHEAHLALIAPYIRGAIDTDLIASIGLDELAAGDSTRAAKFLEKATLAKTSRARAYLELGKLRLKEAVVKPEGPNAKLSDRQLMRVLDPLFQGRSFLPAFPETYSLIAQAWNKASAIPAEANLRVVAKGLSVFPRNTELIYNTALLYSNNHPKAEVLKLVDYAINISQTDFDKQRFLALKNNLTASR